MRPDSLLIDTDAFLAIRSLSVLREMQSAQALRGVIVMCQYAALHELCSTGAEVTALEVSGHLTVKKVDRRTPADRLYRQLKATGVDKGEAEAIAWAASMPEPDRPLFISADGGARAAATKQSIRAGDVLDLVVLLVENSVLLKETARAKLAPWADPEQQQGRPRDMLPFDFDKAFELRRRKGI